MGWVKENKPRRSVFVRVDIIVGIATHCILLLCTLCGAITTARTKEIVHDNDDVRMRPGKTGRNIRYTVVHYDITTEINQSNGTHIQ